MVMGDSITVGFLSYEVLDSSKVVAQTGVHLKDLGPLIDTAANLNPQVLFLALGLNDVALTEGDTDRFIVSYKKVLEQIRSKLPNTVIYINGVLPVTKERQEKNPIYKKIPKYNEALRDLCKEEGITFIDNEPLVEEKYYEPDGEHMGIKYYPVWAEHMAEVAGI